MKVGSMLQGPIRSGSGIPQLEKKRYAKERELLSRMKRILKAGKEAGRIGEQHVSSQRKLRGILDITSTFCRVLPRSASGLLPLNAGAINHQPGTSPSRVVH